MDKSARAVNALDLALALLENGDTLLADATVLLEAGRPTRAIALALIAAEEFGKIYLCLGSITGDDDLPSATSREWRDHRDKLETARALELAFVDNRPDFNGKAVKAEIDWQLRMKMSALYVDHGNSVIRRPVDLDVDVETLIGRGHAKSALLHGLLDSVTPEVLIAMREMGELLSQFVEALVDEDDPDGTVDRLRAVATAATQATSTTSMLR